MVNLHINNIDINEHTFIMHIGHMDKKQMWHLETWFMVSGDCHIWNVVFRIARYPLDRISRIYTIWSIPNLHTMYTLHEYRWIFRIQLSIWNSAKYPLTSWISRIQFGGYWVNQISRIYIIQTTLHEYVCAQNICKYAFFPDFIIKVRIQHIFG